MQHVNLEAHVFTMGINTIISRLEEHDVYVEVEERFSDLVTFLRSEGAFVNPTYDPAFSDLTPADFWVRLTDRNGTTIACSAERVIQTENLVEDIQEGRIWYRHGFADIAYDHAIPTLPFGAAISGKIGHSGSGYTQPAWRGKGLALCMTWLTRLMSFRDLETTTSTGFVRKSLAEGRVPKQSYGFANVEPIIMGYFPPQQSDENLFLCWIDRVTMAHQVLNLPVHVTNPMGLMPGDVQMAGLHYRH